MRTEKTVAAIALAAFILKLMDIPGNGILLTVSLLVLAVMYFPFGYYFFPDKNVKNQNAIISIVASIYLAFISIGILFKLQFWEGEEFYLMLGSIAAPALCVITYYKKNKAKDELKTYYKNMFKRTFVLSILSITFYLIPAVEILKIQHSNDPELLRLKIQSQSDPENQEYRFEVENYIARRDYQ